VFLAVYLVGGSSDPSFGLTSDPHIASRLCSVVYLGYVITWLGRMVRALWALGRVEDWPLNIGAFLAVAGINVAIVGFAWKFTVAVGLGAATVAANLTAGMRATSVGEACGLLLFVIGCAFAAAMRHAHDRATRVRHAREIAAVEQLWRMLEPVRADAVNLDGQGAPDLQQQIVEIFDARVVLRRFVDPVAASRATTVARNHRRRRRRQPGRVAAAVDIAIGLHNYQKHNHPDHGDATTVESTPQVDAWPQASAVFVDEDQRIGWLADVAELVQVISRQLSIDKRAVAAGRAERR